MQISPQISTAKAQTVVIAPTLANNLQIGIIQVKVTCQLIWKLDRLARSTRDLLETMEVIGEAGGRFQSLSEPWAERQLTLAK